MNSVILLWLVILIERVNTLSEERCEARTTHGNLQGKLMKSHSNKDFCAYLGIPYAMPPTGKLRFLPPIPPQHWEGFRNATTEGNKCLQNDPGGSEDCLYLNVFTHNKNVNQSHSVMVFIHGGGFHLGSSSIKNFGPEYFMDNEVVLVTLQYRLGVFGFLSTGDEVVPGNMGLKDQVRAMEWVKENVGFFLGNSEQITIFGNSAGGSSVHMHMQSPLSKNLFERAISQSGTALSSFALTTRYKAKADTEKLALALNCTLQNSTEILKCLQDKQSSEILDIFKKQLNGRYGFNKLFRPVVEVPNKSAFLTKNPMKAITSKPWMVGVNANEGLFKIETDRLNQSINLIHSNFKDFGPHEMFINDWYKNLDELADSVYSFYFKNNSFENDTITSLEQMISDSWFIWPTKQAVQQHNGFLYYYLYNHSSEHSFVEIFNCVRGFGVSHLDELHMLFKQKSHFPPLNEKDMSISKLMVQFWVNFSKEGNPTPDNISTNPHRTEPNKFIWQQTNNTDPSYVHIQTNSLSMETKMFHERMEFWKGLPKKFID